MGKTKRKWLELDWATPGALRAQDIPYGPGSSVKDAIDAIVPGPQGPTGPQGFQGATGPVGVQGYQGHIGPDPWPHEIQMPLAAYVIPGQPINVDPYIESVGTEPMIKMAGTQPYPTSGSATVDFIFLSHGTMPTVYSRYQAGADCTVNVYVYDTIGNLVNDSIDNTSSIRTDATVIVDNGTWNIYNPFRVRVDGTSYLNADTYIGYCHVKHS